ncbi:chemotaxis protein CheW [soil metagenome]
MGAIEKFEQRSSRPVAAKVEGNDIGIAEFLTFRLGGEEYGIDILRVQEIRGYENPTRIANAPAFIKGVINLRGTIVPIVDMRLKFGVGEATYDTFTVVIIMNIANRVVGMVVDSVSDVLTLTPQQIRPTPEFSGALDVSYLLGLGSLANAEGEADRMLILIDIEKLMTSADMELIDA